MSVWNLYLLYCDFVKKIMWITCEVLRDCDTQWRCSQPTNVYFQKSFIVILDLGKHFAWEFFVQMSMFLNHVKKVLKVKIIINLQNKDISLYCWNIFFINGLWITLTWGELSRQIAKECPRSKCPRTWTTPGMSDTLDEEKKTFFLQNEQIIPPASMQLPMVNPHPCARYDPMICQFILTKYFRNRYVGSTNLSPSCPTW